MPPSLLVLAVRSPRSMVTNHVGVASSARSGTWAAARRLLVLLAFVILSVVRGLLSESQVLGTPPSAVGPELFRDHTLLRCARSSKR